MNDESALLAAIIAHPDEDTPRLAYADWLDEHDQPERAEMIRVQCTYTAISPTQREYPDLQEGLWRTNARCWQWMKTSRPPLPPGFKYASTHVFDQYQRGFVHSVLGVTQPTHGSPTAAEAEAICRGWAELVATTTVRKLKLPTVLPTQLTQILAIPEAHHLADLLVSPQWGNECDDLARAIADAESVRRLKQLVIRGTVSSTGTQALTRATFERLEYFDLPQLDCTRDSVAQLIDARWFQSLMQIRIPDSTAEALPALLVGLAHLPRLEHLSLEVAHSPSPKTFPTGRGFRELAQLFLWGEHASRAANWLANEKMPKLIEFHIAGLKSRGFYALRSAAWFKQLWMLYLHNCFLNDRLVTALTKSDLPELRIMRLGNNPFGRAGLLALADGSRLPNLTTLDLNCTYVQNATSDDLVQFATALNRPQLRNLWLDHWPLGPAGAKALAANPSLSNLTALSVNYCRIGNEGMNALVRSPHLRNLYALGVAGNDLNKPTALARPEFLPRLKLIWLQNNRIASASVAQLQATRPWAVEDTDE